MTKEQLEIMVENIMRELHFADWEKYNDEKLRDYYRKMLMEDKDASSKNV